MKIAVRYYTKTSNTKRLAEAVAKAVCEEALPITFPVEDPVNSLCLGTLITPSALIRMCVSLTRQTHEK